MTVSKALEEIARIYEPGCLEHYGRQPDDPWQAMLDKVEGVMLKQDLALNAVIGQWFFNEARRLIEEYRRNVGPRMRPMVTPADGFMMGPDPERFEAHVSLQTRACHRCGGRQGLQPESYGEDRVAVRLVCPACRRPPAPKNTTRAPARGFGPRR